MKDDYYLVIEVGCKAYECGWINYSNRVSLPEAIKIKEKAIAWRKGQGVKDISYHIYSSSEPFDKFLNKVKNQ